MVSGASLAFNSFAGAVQQLPEHSATLQAICQTLLRTQTLEALALSVAESAVHVALGAEPDAYTSMLWQGRANLLARMVVLVAEAGLSLALGRAACGSNLLQSLATCYMLRLQLPELLAGLCEPSCLLAAVEKGAYAVSEWRVSVMEGRVAAAGPPQRLLAAWEGPVMYALVASGVALLCAADGGPGCDLPQPILAAMLATRLSEESIFAQLAFLVIPMEPPPLRWLGRRGCVAVALRAGRLAVARLQRGEFGAVGPSAAAGLSSSGGGVASDGVGGGQGRPCMTRYRALEVLGFAATAAGWLLAGGRQQAAWWRAAMVEW